MELTAGSRLGPYEIQSAIGVGGMGEVYRARDTRLNRTVAIKILPAHLANDQDFRERFEREARTLSQLNHPHICTIHDVGSDAGVHYLVLEHLEGATLADKLAQGSGFKAQALSEREALSIARQIADALEAAHERSIIHRDLKPANIFLTRAGTAKVLDFGLAKDVAVAASASSLSPTFTVAETKAGVILGTAAYMSPEQARGQTVDRRTDVWAFGCVLYEMLTGRQAFGGTTLADVLGAIVHKEPEWSVLPAAASPQVRTLVRRCLEKDPRRRVRDIGDARIEIEDALSHPQSAEPSTATVEPASFAATVAKYTSVAVIAAVLAGLAVWIWRAPAPAARPPVARFTLDIAPADSLWVEGGQPAIAISRDGSTIAYTARVRGESQFFVRSIGDLASRRIDSPYRAAPFFSPDGQWIGYFSAGGLRKSPVGGGAQTTLADAGGQPRGASWGPGDVIVFQGGAHRELMSVPAGGGQPRSLTPSPDGRFHVWPDILPDGRTVLFTTSNGTNADTAIGVQPLPDGPPRILIDQGGTAPRYVPTGHLVYVRNQILMAVPFDLGRLEVRGAAVPVVDGVSARIATGAVQYAFSANGTLVYLPRTDRDTANEQLVWVSRDGKAEPIPGRPNIYFSDPRVSHGGRHLAVQVPTGDGNDIWIQDLARGTLTRLSFEPGTEETAIWSPDDRWVAYASAGSILRRRADGAGDAERLYDTGDHAHVMGWTPDGRALLLMIEQPKTAWNISLLTIDGKPELRSLIATPFNEQTPAISRDGRWLAYVSDESGRHEVFVRPYPGLDGKWQISTNGGTAPVWSRDSRELFFRGEGQMMTVDVGAGTVLTPSTPRRLFEDRYESPGGNTHVSFDVSPDGKRFVMVAAATRESAPQRLVVVQNWFTELLQRVPVK